MHPEFVRATAGTGLRHSQVGYGSTLGQVEERVSQRIPEHVADVVAPGQGAGLPLVVVIHGGFWRAAYDRGHTAAQCVALARAGYVVAALEYRRVGAGGGWPVTFGDVAAGLDALPALLGELIDPARVVLMGHSAGGHLALWAAGRHRLPVGAPGHRARPMAVRGVLCLAGVADLGWAVRADLGAGAVVDLLGATPGRDPEQRFAATDPVRLLPTGIPAICVHGAQDDTVPVACAAAYVGAAQAVGDPASLRELPGVGHMEVIDPGSAAWPHVLRATADLLDGSAG